MKIGDPGNCTECGRIIVLTTPNKKYCVDCAVFKTKKWRREYQREFNRRNPGYATARRNAWGLNNPERDKAIRDKSLEKKRRLIKLARASIELMPSLKELL